MIFHGRGYKLQKHRMPGMHFILMEDYMTEALVYHLAPQASIHHLAAPYPALKGGAGLLQPCMDPVLLQEVGLLGTVILLL